MTSESFPLPGLIVTMSPGLKSLKSLHFHNFRRMDAISHLFRG